jgi:hypothetical protein
MNARRAVSVAALTFLLTLSPYARAAAASTAQIGDPVSDAVQLWTAIADLFGAAAQQLAAALELKQPLAATGNENGAQPASAALVAEQPATPPPTATVLPSATTSAIINQYITEPAIMLAAQTSGSYVTEDQFNAALSLLANSLPQLISENTSKPIVSGPGAPLSAEAFAPSQAIDNLSYVTISNATINSSSISNLSTSQVSEGNNLYYTDARVGSYIDSSSTIPNAAGTLGYVLSWNGSRWAATATSSLGIVGSGGGQWALSGLNLSYSSGNVGIGTTSPSALLSIASTSTLGTVLRLSNASSGGHVFDLISTGASNTSGAGRFDIFDSTSGLARLSIASNGNVGIGTTSPYSLLSVAGQAVAQNFVANSTTNSVLPYLDVTNNTNLFNSMNDYKFGYSATTTPNIIWDSDMGDDEDTAGAAAMLLHAADLGQVNILAETYSGGRNCGVSVFSADDTYYGRSNIPIGQDPDPVSVTSDNYCTLTQEHFPNSENGSTTPSALIVDRKALADAPDASVTMIFAAPLRDLYNLYNSPADSISPLTGQQLIAEKVVKIVIMGGDYPSGAEFNFTNDPVATQVINELATTTSSTPVIFIGYTLGTSVITGGSFVATPATSPIMFAYNQAGYSRPSWSGIAMFYAIYGLNYNGTSYFAYGTPGYNSVQSTGDNAWNSGATTSEEYLVSTAPTTTIAATLNSLMSALPARNEAPFTLTSSGLSTPYNFLLGQTSFLSAPLGSNESVAIGQRPADDGFASLVLNPTQTLTRGFEADVYDTGTTTYYFQLYDRVASQARMTINSSGNVGIGTTTPQGALSVEGSILIDKASVATPATTGAGQTGSILHLSALAAGQLQGFDVGFSPSAPFGTWMQAENVTNNSSDYPLLLNPNGGNVGIGTFSPNSKLEVQGVVAAQSFNATSTIATSTLSGGLTIGGSQFVVQQGSGYVGIGTTTPAVPLSVAGQASFDSAPVGTPYVSVVIGQRPGNDHFTSLVLDPVQNINRGFDLDSYDANTSAYYFQIYDRVASAVRMTVNSSGNVGIGTTNPYSRLQISGPDTASTSAFAVVNSASTTEFTIYDTGNAVLAGSLTQNSDQRLKTNIQSLNASSSLSLIDQLNPVTFNWIDPNKGSTPQLGFIAQQVLPIFPNLVATTSPTALTPDGTLSLNYIDLVSPIVSAIQALSSEITSIENEIAGFATIFHTQELCVGSTCVTPAQFQVMVAAVDASQGGGPSNSPADEGSASSTPDAPPVIQINGNNPAFAQVGATYNDLGATISGPQADLNLGITTFLNGTLTSNIVVDTSQAATDTIDYVATDQNGLTSTSTRTVIVEALAASNPPSISASSTDATSSPSAQ